MLANYTRDQLRRFIEEYEGRRSRTYLDSEGIPTVGVGFNLHKSGAKSALTKLGLDYDSVIEGKTALSDSQIDRLFGDDIATAERDASELYETVWSGIDACRQLVIVDMVFNLGITRYRGFAKTIAAIRKSDWDEAADEMIDSRWYRQVKRRGVRNVQIMRTGSC